MMFGWALVKLCCSPPSAALAASSGVPSVQRKVCAKAPNCPMPRSGVPFEMSVSALIPVPPVLRSSGVNDVLVPPSANPQIAQSMSPSAVRFRLVTAPGNNVPLRVPACETVASHETNTVASNKVEAIDSGLKTPSSPTRPRGIFLGDGLEAIPHEGWRPQPPTERGFGGALQRVRVKGTILNLTTADSSRRWAEGMTQLRNLLRRSGTEQGLLVSALCWVACIRAALWLLPYRIVRPLVDRGARKPERDADELTAARVAWAVSSAARFVPRATCVTQALAARRLLARCGLASEVCYGVGRLRGRVIAHAWLESGGRVIVGDQRLESLLPLASLERRMGQLRTLAATRSADI